MKLYELTYLISPDLPEEEIKSLVEEINSLIQKGEGILNKTVSPIKKWLPLAVKEKTSAYLATLNFQLKPEGLENLEKKLKSESKILRYLILAKPPAKTPAIFRKKATKEKPIISRKKVAEKKVELKEIEKKLEEILKE